MKSATILISTLTLSLFLFSCGNTPNEQSENHDQVEEHEGHEHNDETEAIELNNGDKWKVDTNMITHIRNMEKDINSFANIEKRDYKMLSEKLQTSIDLLTSNCTMEGKAHDELHKWLLPYIELAEDLSKAKNEDEAAKQFENLQTSFATFNAYFQ